MILACTFVSLIASACVRQDRTRDGVIQAPIECTKFNICDWSIRLDGELRNGLTEIPVIVNDLIQGKAHPQKLISVIGGGLSNSGGGFGGVPRGRGVLYVQAATF